jgi:hypothetical protein
MSLLTAVADQYFGIPYYRHPVEWSRDKLGNFLWSKQVDILTSVRDNRYTAVPACHDSSKSYTAAVATCWWLESHPLGEAFVISTAPSAPQVTTILWREVLKLHGVGELQGVINMGGAPEWKVGKQQIAYGRKPADYNADIGFQGVHSLFPLIIVDEASGIPDLLWNAVDSLATNDNARVLAIGNPDDIASHFRSICLPGSGWNVIKIDGLQTPNMTERAALEVSAQDGCGDLYQFMVENNIPFATEEIPEDLQPRLLGARWVAERMKRWGVYKEPDTGKWKTSSLWESKVRGEFPTDSTEGVIPLAWIEAAIRRWQDFFDSGADPAEVPGLRRFACDVARYGKDETAIAEKQGHVVIGVERIGNQDTMTTANRLVAKLDSHILSTASVDVIGVGAGVVDRLRELGKNVYAFNAASRTDRRDVTGEFRFANTRSAAWWHLRELLDPSNPDTNLCLPPDERLKEDLIAPRWRPAPGAIYVVEPKDETIRRLGRSPDTGDAVVMLMWNDFGGSSNEGVIAEYGGTSEFAIPWEGEGNYYD